MLFYLNFVVFIVTVGMGLQFKAVQAKFPEDPKPCKYGDEQCIAKIIGHFLHHKSAGDNSINLVKIDPLSVTKINIKQGEESPVNIDLEFTDNKINGLSDSTVTKVKGFGQDLKQKHEIGFRLKRVALVGDYKITGRVLILPINGKGKSNMTMVNTDMALQFSGTPFEKDGATYMKIDNLKLKVNPEHIYYYFGNLFNGDKALGDNMNLFLNENWEDIFNEVRFSITETFSKIFQNVLNNVFSKYPYEKFFQT